MTDFAKNMQAMVPVMGDKYYHTSYEGMADFELFDRAMLHGFNIKLQGPTGVGKTTSFEAYCSERAIPHVVVNMKGTTSTEELIGAWAPSENGAGFVWKDGLIPRALKYSNLYDEVTLPLGVDGKPKYPEVHYIHLDDKGMPVGEDVLKVDNNHITVKQYKPVMLTVEEINFSPEELMSVWFSLLDARRNIVLGEKNGEVITAGKNFSANATMNPDYVGTNKLNRALEDRFTIKLNVNYDKKVENKIVQEMGEKYKLPYSDVKFILTFINKVRIAFKNEGITTNISTRMIRAYLQLCGTISREVAYACLMNSFDDMDRDTIKEMIDISRSEKVDLDMNSAEVEGMDFTKFEGFKAKVPLKAAPKASTAPKSASDVKVPF
jgi:MoxR-like ATPase